MAHKIQATEYVSPGGRARGWWVERSRGGYPLAGYAIRVRGLSRPWVARVTTHGRFGHDWRGQYASLPFCRMHVVGGNGHVYRGSTSIVDVRPMSLCNILALAARPTDRR